MNAKNLLIETIHLLDEMGKECSLEKEESMTDTIKVFNIITGNKLSTAEGMLLLGLLKIIRDRKRNVSKQETCKDIVAYAALYAEERFKENNEILLL